MQTERVQAEKEMQTERVTSEQEMQTERVRAESRNLQNQLANTLKMGILDAEKAVAIQNLINSGNLELAEKELEGVTATLTSEEKRQTERVGQEERQSQRDYALAKDELLNRLTMANIDKDKAMEVQRLINSGQLDLAEAEIASAEAMQTERLAASSADLAAQLQNNIDMGNIDANKAIEIQNLINSGNLELAQAEIASAEAMQTERVEQEERQSQRDYAVQKDELQNRLTLANIDLDKATRIQNLINSGNLDLAEKELEGVTATLASEEKRQTERLAASSADLAAQLENNIAMGNIDKNKATEIQTLINTGNLELAEKELEGITATLASEEKRQTERVTASSADLAAQLQNNIDMGNIDANKAIEIQSLINSGNLELAQAEIASAEAMQTERIESQEGQFNSELEFRKAVETGQIDGMPTLQSMLTRADLADRLSARQSEGLGQLLAMANAIENDDHRARMISAITKPMRSYINQGGGYTQLKNVYRNMLDVNIDDYLPE